jgi:FKBP-type peptidyl-prolyl cis-trans isomerase
MNLKTALVSTLALVGISTILLAQAPTTAPATAQPKERTTSSGLKITVVAEGDAVTKTGDTVWVHYTGKLADGKQFDTSVGRGPFELVLGQGRVIKGWEEGLLGMKVGEKRKLVIPPDLGYGPQGYGPIPGNATLTFDVELLGMKRG